MKWAPKGKRESIVIPWAEVAVNKTKAGVIKLVGRKMDVVKNALKDKIGNDIDSASASVTLSKAWT
jgi:hypothetical protein